MELKIRQPTRTSPTISNRLNETKTKRDERKQREAEEVEQRVTGHCSYHMKGNWFNGKRMGGDSRIDGWMDREIIWVVACGR